jgi:large subunit ribosomal protein L25
LHPWRKIGLTGLAWALSGFIASFASKKWGWLLIKETEMSDIFEIAAEKRERAGKGIARALRREGLVPAVIYGDKKDPEGISLQIGEIKKLFNTGRMMNTLLEIDLEGKKQRVIARDVQLHPVRDDILHADFLRLGKGAKIAVEVSVTFLNEETCPGLKQGGVLNVVRYTVELNCPADNIPETIELDLAEAEMNDSLHISEVKLPDGVEPVISDRDFTIATIAAPAALKSEEAGEDSNEEGDDAEGAEEAEGGSKDEGGEE